MLMGVTVRQKSKGKGKPWWVFVSHNGRRTSRKVGDKSAADDVASKIQAQLTLGKFEFEREEPQKVPTFKEYAETFMNGYSKNNHKRSTQENYVLTINKYFLPVFGNNSLDGTTRNQVKQFLFNKQADGFAIETVKNLRGYLSSIFSEAIDDGIIAINPVANTGKYIKKAEKLEGDTVKPLTWEEKAQLEKTVENLYPRYYPLILTALRTGMRYSELIALKPDDLNFEEALIEVRRGCVRGRVGPTKNRQKRKVDMSPQLGRVLRDWLTKRKEETLKSGWGKPPEWLFYNVNGKTYKYTAFRKTFNKLLDRSKLRRITFHQLRHTYATLRLLKSDNIIDVSRQLGHSSIQITEQTYCHWIPGNNQNQVAELDLPTAPSCTPAAPKSEKKTISG